MRIAILAAALAGVLADSLSAAPQGGQSLTGVIVDATGGVLPFARVELQTMAGVPVSSTTADAGGAFRLDQVPPGRYDLRAEFEGFQPATVRVVVSAGRPPAPLRIVLPLAGVSQEVTVVNRSEGPGTEAAENQDAVTVGDRTLADLPAFDQDLVGTMARFLDATAIGTGGVTLVVNGMEANGVGVTASAIKEIKINQDPYSAEFNRPGRGRIEVITKPGSTAYHGTANAIVRDSRFNAREPFAVEKPPNERRIFEGYLGGPIGDGSRSSFVLSLNHDGEDRQAIVHALQPGGLLDASVPAPFRNTFVSGSASHQHGERTTISVRTSFQYRRTSTQGVGGLTLPEAATNNLFHELESVYTHDTVVSPVLLHQARVLYGQYFNGTSSVTEAPGIVVLGAFTGGGAQADFLRTEHHVEVKDTLTWTPGRHTIKGGVDLPDWSRRRFDDNSNRAGTFYFANLAAYQAGTPFVFVEQQGDGHEVFLEKVLGLFVQDEMQVSRALTASIGLRYDWQNYFRDDDNLGPRMSMAWAPAALGGTVVRAGAGLFYDRTGPGPISDLLHSEHGRLIRYVVSNPGYPAPVPPGQSLAAAPPSIVRLAPGLTIPATWQYSVGIERRIAGGVMLSASYIGVRSDNLFRSRDVNAPPPPAYAARPDPAYGVVRQIESTGRMRTHGLQLTVRRAAGRYVSGQAQYTLSRTYNDTDGIGWFPSNDYDLPAEWGLADYDQRHRLNVLGTLAAGDWLKLSVALALYAGRPYSLLAGQDLYHNGRSNARPPGVGRNTLTGPDYADLDLRWSREVVARAAREGGEPWKVAVGIDAFNVLNRTNFVSYVGTVASPLFGQAVAAQPPRRLQFSLRASF